MGSHGGSVTELTLGQGPFIQPFDGLGVYLEDP